MIDEDDKPSVEAHCITISYGFYVDGEEYISIDTGEEEMSTPLLLGILEYAKHRVLLPTDDEDDEADTLW